MILAVHCQKHQNDTLRFLILCIFDDDGQTA